MKNLLIASTSTVYGEEYLDYLNTEMAELFKDTEEVIFIPFARPGGISHDGYTEKAAKPFQKIGKKLIGLHTFENPAEVLKNAKGAFTGGGNTFVLVSTLYRLELMQPLREAIFNGLAYMGTSAGSNICGVSMQTTNDMPIVYPPSFKTLGAISFNLNPHYLDPDPSSKHMGETRETRIAEFHSQNNIPVIGLHEGSWLRVKGDEIMLKGELNARIFEQAKEPFEIESGTILNLNSEF
ncbi:dipeptidase PepE [Aequorivita sp. SDUM287046]|uniref:Dipeptidase PepE n=1 Tax=Aequorivita aurantiaca TaxID=3053356 RepID=A0ABT8DIC7_9FLAO|nr:dipeptidase PepE [Aequorivita aurantiaca]MDN3724554.1 dipeptidase PepE [Aequorivita aurantiaca]